MNKKFEIFESCLKQSIKEFRNKKIFSFIGLAGSLNIKNDLDLIITPINEIKRGKFLIYLVDFLKILKIKLNKEGVGLIIFHHFYAQEEIEYISKRRNKDLFIHLITFNSFNVKKDKIKAGFLKSIKKVYHGNRIYLNKIKQKKLDFYYGYLFFTISFYSRYSKSLLKNKIYKKIDYIKKHTKIKLKITGKPLIDWINCCKALDKISKN